MLNYSDGNDLYKFLCCLTCHCMYHLYRYSEPLRSLVAVTMDDKIDSIATLVAKECFDKFKSLPKQGKPTDNQWTVLSGIVLVKEVTDNVELKIVSLATGTKCLDGSTRMGSNPGTLLHDCHAEVLVRRGFLAWMIEEMLVTRTGSSKFICEITEDKFELVDGWKVFMLSTHPPCGDATIFEKESDNENYGDKSVKKEGEPPIKKMKLDINRTGAKCVNGSDPHCPGVGYHNVGLLRTKPGRGERTLSLSCSDKIMKWNILGLQGALCSYFLSKTIHLHCFILSSKLFNESALSRALYQRAGFDIVNKPRISQVNLEFEFTKTDTRVNPCPDSVVWVAIRGGKVESLTEGHKQGWSKKKLSNPKSWSMLCQRNITKTVLELGSKMGLVAFQTYSELKSKSPANLNRKIVENSILHDWPVKDVSTFSLTNL